MRLRIASRKSPLARIQAYKVGDALGQLDSTLKIHYEFRESLGDIHQDDPLWKMPEQGVFTKDFLSALINEDCDLVVHSWKDLPIEAGGETEIVATMEREDQRDMLLFPRRNLSKLKEGEPIRILSSSPRRIHNLGKLLPTLLPYKPQALNFVDVRGNIATRIEKLMRGDGEGLVVAKAALDRILCANREEFSEDRKTLAAHIQKCLWMVLPLSQNPTAAAQGALAIEIKRGRSELKQLLGRLNHTPTFQNVARERKIHADHGGGCHQKIGVSLQETRAGSVLSLLGETESGDQLGEYRRLECEQSLSGNSDAEIWPNTLAEAQLFERVGISGIDRPAGPLLVARADAYLGYWSHDPAQILWVSGLKTWANLVQRGIWIHGCLDGLGEQTLPQLDHYFDGSNPGWTKLSHTSAPEVDGIKLLPTYELRSSGEFPDLRSVTHFFWPSLSLFDAALELCPEIVVANHACGPGNTLKGLRTRLEKGTVIGVFLSHQDWRAEIKS